MKKVQYRQTLICSAAMLAFYAAPALAQSAAATDNDVGEIVVRPTAQS